MEGRSPYGWEAEGSPVTSPGAPVANGSPPADAAFIDQEMQKERAKIRKTVEHEMKAEMAKVEKDKKAAHREIEKCKRQIEDMNEMKEKASKSRQLQKELEKMKMENADLKADQKQKALLQAKRASMQPAPIPVKKKAAAKP